MLSSSVPEELIDVVTLTCRPQNLFMIRLLIYLINIILLSVISLLLNISIFREGISALLLIKKILTFIFTEDMNKMDILICK